MNSLERVAAAVNGGIPDKVPVALHNFLLAAKMANIPMSHAFQNGKLLAETQLFAWRRFKHDMLLVESGTSAMAQAMGCEVAYADDHPPYVAGPVLRSWSDIDKLTVPDPTRAFPLVCLLEATRILRDEIGNKAFCSRDPIRRRWRWRRLCGDTSNFTWIWRTSGTTFTYED